MSALGNACDVDIARKAYSPGQLDSLPAHADYSGKNPVETQQSLPYRLTCELEKGGD